MKSLIKFIYCSFIALAVVSCTDLEEQALDGVIPEGSGGSGASADILTLVGDVAGLHNEWSRNLGVQEMPGDAMAGPTRGGDWDDNAALRQIHAHTWAPDHPWIGATFNVLMTGIYNADLILNDSSQSSDHHAAKLLKAYFYFHMMDKFGQVPYRDSYDDMTLDAMVYTRAEAFAIAVSLATDALSGLPEKASGGADSPNKDAARMLLAKLHLNRAVFTGEAGATSFTHDAADMTAVIDYVDDMTSTLNDDTTDGTGYWANFDKDNNSSDEIIWALKQEQGASDSKGYTGYYWRMGQHYNQTPGGWNGPVMVGEYYDYFLENGVADGDDPRVTWSTPEIVDMTGNNVGVLRGQIYEPKKWQDVDDPTKCTTDDASGILCYEGGVEKVEDRKGNMLIYTKDTPLVVLDPVAIESAGYRTIKYIPDDFDNANADYAIYRMADAMLMRAEAALLGGSGGNAQADIDAVRARVGLGSITANLDNVYAERARELWWEGHRRTDMVRWGTFLSSKELKPAESDSKYLLFPIPADALINPNMNQNPGY